MAKGCAICTGYLPRGGLPRNSVDRITDRPDMTSAVDRGRKASTQTNKQDSIILVVCIYEMINLLLVSLLVFLAWQDGNPKDRI